MLRTRQQLILCLAEKQQQSSEDQVETSLCAFPVTATMKANALEVEGLWPVGDWSGEDLDKQKAIGHRWHFLHLEVW